MGMNLFQIPGQKKSNGKLHIWPGIESGFEDPSRTPP